MRANPSVGAVGVFWSIRRRGTPAQTAAANQLFSAFSDDRHRISIALKYADSSSDLLQLRGITTGDGSVGKKQYVERVSTRLHASRPREAYTLGLNSRCSRRCVSILDYNRSLDISREMET